MRLIILFLFVSLTGYGQSVIKVDAEKRTFAGSNVGINTMGIVYEDVDVWANNIADNYLLNNTHFSEIYAADLRKYLIKILSSTYVMSNDSVNYFQKYGPNGLNKTTSEWLFVLRYFGDISQVTANNVKTGAVMLWNCDNSLYYQNDVPTHSIGTGDGWILVTSPDGFTGLTSMYLSSNTFTGEFPNIDWRVGRAYLNSNNFFGEFPNLVNPSCQYLVVSTNFLNNFQSISGILSGTFERITAQYNNFTQSVIDGIINQLLVYYQAHTPTKNVIIDFRYGSNSPPSATGLANITTLQGLFTAASKTFTIYVN